MDLSGRIVGDVDELESLRGAWDELAVEARRPFSAPAWSLSWWRHLRPEGARLQTVVLEDGDGVAAVVPLYAQGRLHRPLGGGLAPVEPLARPGLEGDAAAVTAATLASAQPRPVALEVEAHGASADWTAGFAGAWPGREAWHRVEAEPPVPLVDLGEGFEEWMAAKSGSFRRDVRRNGRKLTEAGGSFRFATAETVERDLAEFLRLHRLRLGEQGGSSLPERGVEEMLAGVASDLLPSGRFRLLCLDVDGSTVAAQLLLAAGREVSAWNSGFDSSFAAFSPSMQCLLHALEDAAGRGERTMSLGPGGQPYKYRLADGEDRIVKALILPRGAAYPLQRARRLPRQARQAAAARLSPELKGRLRDLLRR